MLKHPIIFVSKCITLEALSDMNISFVDSSLSKWTVRLFDQVCASALLDRHVSARRVTRRASWTVMWFHRELCCVHGVILYLYRMCPFRTVILYASSLTWLYNNQPIPQPTTQYSLTHRIEDLCFEQTVDVNLIYSTWQGKVNYFLN